jgi:type I site-specific restriction endonuclease
VTPEQRARQGIDRFLAAAGWAVQDFKSANLYAAQGAAIREFALDAGRGFADDLIYVDGKACGVVEAKKQGTTFTGAEVQSARYAQGLPASLPAWQRTLPFLYESTGVDTHFTQVGRLSTIAVPPLAEQHGIVAEVDRHLSIIREVEADVDANLKRAQALRGAVLSSAFGSERTSL